MLSSGGQNGLWNFSVHNLKSMEEDGQGKNGEQMRENIFKDSKITCAFLYKTFSKIGKGFFKVKK